MGCNCVAHANQIKGMSMLVLVLLITSDAGAQHFEAAQPAGKEHGALLSIPRVVAGEFAATTWDFATFRDKQWQILTLAQIGAASADAETSLYNLRHCASCEEIGDSRLIVGRRPDAHKYIVAGLVEITIEAVAGHYLRNHGPIRKWYWRYVWTLPQTFSLYEHANAAVRNTGVNLGCYPAGQHCN